jgi:hypothetical protein
VPFTYPALQLSAGDGSLAGQRRFIRATRVRLVALVVAALGGAMAWQVGTVDLFGWLALGVPVRPRFRFPRRVHLFTWTRSPSNSPR